MRLALATASLLLVAGAVAACDSGAGSDDASGPDPATTADALAAALVSGDFTDVPLTEETADEVAADYAKVVDGMGDVEPVVVASEPETSGDTATVQLRWTWPLAGDEWTYTTDATLAKAGDAWAATWSRDLVEPSLRKATVLDVTPIGGARGPIVGADGFALVTDRPVVRFGIDRSQVPAAKAGDSARRLAQLVDVDVAPYVKQVEAAGDKAYVEAIVFRQAEVPAAVENGYRDIPGAIAIDDEIPLAPYRDFAAPILGAVGEVSADGQPLPTKRLMALAPEARVRLDLPGGGGVGDPRARDPQAVLRDVVDGYVSLEAAQSLYGVTIKQRRRNGRVLLPEDFEIQEEA
jgi:hypothetical protein